MVILQIVLLTSKSKLENIYEESNEDRVTVLFCFFRRDLGLQNHQEITAP